MASGLGILPLRTEMLDTKILQRAEYEGQEILKGCRVSGYEIHAGRSQLQQAKWVDLVEPSGLCVWDEKQKILEPICTASSIRVSSEPLAATYWKED